MKILHIVHQFAPESSGGGVESYVDTLARAQMAAGLEVAVLTGSKQGRPAPVVEQFEVDGLEVHRVHRNDIFFDHYASSWNPLIEALIEDLLGSLRPDLAHVHHWIRLSTNLVELADRSGIPCVVTLHDAYASCPRVFRVRPGDAACMRPLSVESCAGCVPRFGCEPPGELAEGIDLYRDQCRAELSMSRAVLVGIQPTADLIHDMTGFPRELMQVLPLGYRRRFTGASLPVPAPRPDELFRFAFWGSIGPHKGVHTLLGAFRRLIDAGPVRDTALHVLGEIAPAELRRDLERMARGLPVRFHGAFGPEHLLEVAPHMGIFPSTCLETFGLVLDECFELGIPCIVSDKGALPVRAAQAGIVVPSGDVEALAGAMQRVLSDPGIVRGLRTELPELPPTPEAHEQQLRPIYDRAITGPRPAAGPVAHGRRLAFMSMRLQNALGRVSPEGPR